MACAGRGDATRQASAVLVRIASPMSGSKAADVDSHPVAEAAAAATWEALRDHTAPVAFTGAVADMLAAHLGSARLVVDVGAGSGQLLAALAARGLPVIAVDLSVPMLQRVPAGLSRAAADTTWLPMRDGGAGGVLAAHVLHVVADWQAAVVELDRVAGPDGLVLVQAGSSSGAQGPAAPLRGVFRDHLPARAMVGNGMAEEPAVLDAAFAALGRTADNLPEIRTARPETPRGVLAWLQGNPWTWPGRTTEAERADAAAAVVSWAAAAGLDLDEPFETFAVNRWRSYRHVGP